MGKKNKNKNKGKEVAHERLHRAVNDWIVQHSGGGDTPKEQHVLPIAQPWHYPSPQCWCRPRLVHTNSMTGSTIWRHPLNIH